MSDLPTIKQIIRQADLIGSTPMDDEESREWFERTCAKNRRQASCAFCHGEGSVGQADEGTLAPCPYCG